MKKLRRYEVWYERILTVLHDDKPKGIIQSRGIHIANSFKYLDAVNSFISSMLYMDGDNINNYRITEIKEVAE